MSDLETSIGGPGGEFFTTRWTLFRQRNLDEIVRSYWKPVYIHLRRKGHSIEDAKDLTQGFFARFLEKDFAAQADPSRGRFRSFIRACLDHFVSDELDRAKALKRGGGNVVALDPEAAEKLIASEDSFDRQWARSILEDAMEELAHEYAERGQSKKFSEIRPHLSSGTCEDRSTLHRARQRFALLVRRRVAETVENPGEVEDELKYLFESLRQTPGQSS